MLTKCNNLLFKKLIPLKSINSVDCAKVNFLVLILNNSFTKCSWEKLCKGCLVPLYIFISNLLYVYNYFLIFFKGKKPKRINLKDEILLVLMGERAVGKLEAEDRKIKQNHKNFKNMSLRKEAFISI